MRGAPGNVPVSLWARPPLIPTRVTRSSNFTELLFRPNKNRTSSFQKSCFIRVTRVRNCFRTSLSNVSTTKAKYVAKYILNDCYGIIIWMPSILIMIQRTQIHRNPCMWLNCNPFRRLSNAIFCCF